MHKFTNYYYQFFVTNVIVDIGNKVIGVKVKLFVATETSLRPNIGHGHQDKLKVYGNVIVAEIAQDIM